MHTIHQKGIDIRARGTYSSFKKSLQSRGTGGGIDIRRKKIREPEMVIIRNKFTKEIVDLEVSLCCFTVDVSFMIASFGEESAGLCASRAFVCLFYTCYF